MQEKRRRTMTGTVVSRSGDKSICVVVEYTVKHPKYGKYINRRTKIGVHDARNEGGIGDKVEVAHCRPYSKAKSWRLVKILEKAVQK